MNSSTKFRTACALGLVIVVGLLPGALLGGLISSAVANSENEQYKHHTGVIVGEPTLLIDNSGGGAATAAQAPVAVDAGSDLRTMTAVELQAAVGDRVSVWVDSETGRIWRQSTPNESPITGVLANTTKFAVLSLLLTFILVYLGTVSRVRQANGNVSFGDAAAATIFRHAELISS